MYLIFFRRIILLLPVLLGISTIIFVLQRLIPGTPADFILGLEASEKDKIQWLKIYGLDKSIWEQYVNFLVSLVHADFGRTYADATPVINKILPRLYNTVRLAITAFSVSLFFALFTGIISAIKAGKAIDKFFALFSLFAVSAPSFIIGPILMWIFSVKLELFPLIGIENWKSFVLPSVSLGLALAAFSSRIVRSGLVDVLNEDYIRTAYSKGLSPFTVIFKHALKNAFLPALTIFGMQFGVLLSGAVVTEQIFAWPGLGTLTVEAVQAREYNIVAAAVILMATIYAVSNLVVDILYRIFDPRIRFE